MRTKPYTKAGIKRMKCFRCNAPASAQWQICSDGNQYRPICTECDVKLNRLVVEFMGFKDVDGMMSRYKGGRL